MRPGRRRARRAGGAAANGSRPGRPGDGGNGPDRSLAGAAGGLDAPSVLTGRELQIAELVARGLSNRGIAAELTISPATAARHVANIFGKLGFTSRAQVAAWTAERESRRRSAPGGDIAGPGPAR